jgi:hypothetical protein
MNFKIVYLKKILILISLVFLLNSCFWKASTEKVSEEKNEKISQSQKSEIIKKKVLDIK